MTPRYKISITNKVYFIFAATFVVTFIAINVTPSTAEPPRGITHHFAYQAFHDVRYTVVYVFASLFVLLFLPSLFARFAWSLSGKRENGGSWIFNIVLTLLLLGHVAQASQQSQEIAAAKGIERDYQQAVQTFKTTVGDTPGTTQTAYSQFTNSVEQTFDKESQKSTTGTEKKFYKILKDFIAHESVSTNEWFAAFHAVQAANVLNYSFLTSDEKFEQQKKVIADYIAKSKQQQKHFANILPSMKKRLSVLGENHPIVTEAMRGATDKHYLQKPIFEPLIESHIDYGNGMLQILNLLQKNRGKWTCVNGQLWFYNDGLQKQYNQLLPKLIENENQINTLSPKLLETL